MCCETEGTISRHRRIRHVTSYKRIYATNESQIVFLNLIIYNLIYDDTRVKRSESRCKLVCKRIFAT